MIALCDFASQSVDSISENKLYLVRHATEFIGDRRFEFRIIE